MTAPDVQAAKEPCETCDGDGYVDIVDDWGGVIGPAPCPDCSPDDPLEAIDAAAAPSPADQRTPTYAEEQLAEIERREAAGRGESEPPEGYIVPEGDQRCGFVMDACQCMKRKGHDGLHACAHGGWRGQSAGRGNG